MALTYKSQISFSCTFAHLLVILIDVAVSKLFPTQLAFVRFVFAVDDLMSRHLIQALEWSTADLASVRSLLWWGTNRSLSSERTWYMKKAVHLCRTLLPECVIIWRFSWLVEMNFLSHAWHSNISWIYNTKREEKKSFNILVQSVILKTQCLEVQG